ncbi:MAG: serine/threonine-protein kinase [Planctomycetota bacterium]|nr:serine/threonine-protein kinase [Planctomycetota bacterium]
MAVAHSASQFLEMLERSRLLTPEEIEAAVEKLGVCDDDGSVPTAKAFVRGNYLTRLQASRLLEGQHRGFFIDHFRIDDILGSGGMGWVYSATNLDTHEKVAIKMLCEQNDRDAGLLTRFKLEARAGLMLKHEAIVRTQLMGHTQGIFGDIHYMVMDYVAGIGVDEFVALLGGPIKWRLACHIAYHAGAGLHHAHRKGLIHRDVKPSNILVDKSANAKVLDFGLSQVSKSDHSDEFSLAMIFGQDCLGTADYIAPEQASDSFNIDHRADIYSLGATLYYMLTGSVLFDDCKTRAEKIDAQKTRTPVRIRQLQPDVPAEVEMIVNRMLEKNPGDRFTTAKIMCSKLVTFAKPSNIRFDFQKILDRRYTIAKQREKLLNDRAKRSAQQTSLTVCSLDSQATRTSPSAIETSILKDTEFSDPSQRPDEIQQPSECPTLNSVDPGVVDSVATE